MATQQQPVCQIFSFRDCKSSPDPILDPLVTSCGTATPIVIDNGSFQTRADWATVDLDSPRLLFRSVAARSRGAARSETQIGNDIPNLEPLRWLLKSQFDRNVVVNFEIQELIFDHVFTHLGITSEGRVEHPIVLTEAPCNPLHCRQMMSELLFECYGVPHVSYGVDALYSFHHTNNQKNLRPPQTGIILSSGYHCSHILPVLNGRLDAVNSKRVNVAGGQAAAYLQRLLQLKYPGHLAAITLSRMEELLHEHSYTAVDYQEELEKWRSPEFYEREVHRMQLPFSGKLPGGCVSVEERQERRAQQLRRLQESNARRRGEKLHQDQERLDRLMAVQELLEDGFLDQFHKSLVELNMDSAEELQSYISKLQLAVEQGRQKLLHSDGAEGKTEVSELEQQMEEGDGMVMMYPDFSEDTLTEKPNMNVVQPAFNMAEYHQLFVGTERLRCPEILFQPSLTGEDQMGMMETLQYVLARYTPEQQEALVSNVFLTGGNMQYPGMKERVERELLAIRPFQSHFKVTLAMQPTLGAWLGARDWALEHPPGCGGGRVAGWISRQDYEEKGGEYLSEHCASNVFVPIKINKTLPARQAEPSVTLPTEASGPVRMVTSSPTSSSLTSDVPMVSC
ncbi:actin-related protein 5 isoform X1 [Hippocampus comes]|uniref:actin-related protein 5 isoform X1 n=1 Tax=Hippocampus comes TaxID=109280 RepID=UPI00094E4A27|nr:PREDICTED: actin-related protein 5 isoform X1 [Hippocampus comes]XP_019728736.1 PREDICTED: actin-related protein 5 isoform X1 [Hippocampus comes]